MQHTIKHRRSDWAHHYNGASRSRSCGIQLSIEIEEDGPGEILLIRGLHSQGLMSRLGICLDLDHLPELIDALTAMREEHRRLTNADV